MSDAEKSNTGKALLAWSDKERLVYLFALLEQTGAKPDYKNTPRPNGRSEIACQRMVDRLKNTIKDDLEALKLGNPIGDETPKKSPKRKTTAKATDADGEGSPKKRGRKKKTDVDTETKAEDNPSNVKAEEI